MKKTQKQIKFICMLVVLVILVFGGCGELNKSTVQVEKSDQLVALLGDLDDKISDKRANEINELLLEANDLLSNREKTENYEMSEEENNIWEQITKLLDKETKRQFGAMDYEDEEEQLVDYGEIVLENLKETISTSDYKKIVNLRNTYYSEETEDTDGGIEAEDDDCEIQEEDKYSEIENDIRNILSEYKNLDVDATMLNLFEDMGMDNIAMYEITSDEEVEYQPSERNGLKPISLKKQEEYSNIWKTVTDVLPADYFDAFDYFKIATDGEYNTYAYVINVDERGKNWCITIDPADTAEDGFFSYTIVHEFSHYLSLNDTQVDYYIDKEWDYYPLEVYCDDSCIAKENSYIQEFYLRFWKEIICDYNTDHNNPYFYERHQSEFITEYAATHCTEDFAEAFCGYVLLEEAPTPEIQKKFDFFDEYEEFRKIKQDVENSIKTNGVYVSPVIE